MTAEHESSDLASPDVSAHGSADPVRASHFFFEGWTFDVESGELEHAGQTAKLRNQTARVLALLLRRAGAVVSRSELRAELWGDETFVEYDQGINTCIREIRIALEDSTEAPRFVETLAGRGYRFVALLEAARSGGSPADSQPAIGAEGLPEATQRPTGSGHARREDRGGGRSRPAHRKVGAVVLFTAILGALALLVAQPAVVKNRGAGLPLRVLLAPFDNQTGEEILDDSLELAFRVGLERHRGLEIVTPEEVRAVLQRMHRGDGTLLDRDLSLEVAQRLDADLLIVASTVRVGSRYLEAAEILDPRRGSTVYAGKQLVEIPEDLLAALDRLVEKVAEEMLGGGRERESGSERASLAQVTTGNLEALKAYSTGVRALRENRPAEGQFLIERAVELDPGFAMAHAKLGVLYRNGSDTEKARKHFTLAEANAERLTSDEALYVNGWRATLEPDPERALRSWTLFMQRPAGRWTGLHNSAMAKYLFYADFTGCAEALDELLGQKENWTDALAGRPSLAGTHVNRALCRLGAGDAAGARADVDWLLSDEEVQHAAAHMTTILLLGLGDLEAAERKLRALEGPTAATGSTTLADDSRVLLAIEQDRPDEAIGVLQRIADSYRREGNSAAELGARINQILLLDVERRSSPPPPDSWGGVERSVRERIDDLLGGAVTVSVGVRVRILALWGAYWSRQGALERARTIRDEIEALSGRIGGRRLWPGHVEQLDAEIALLEGRPRDAVSLLERSFGEGWQPPLHAYETLARAYAESGDRAAAAGTYHWIASHRGRAYADSLGFDQTVDQVRNVAVYHQVVEMIGGRRPRRD